MTMKEFKRTKRYPSIKPDVNWIFGMFPISSISSISSSRWNQKWEKRDSDQLF
jgi:hypothetical protein